MGTAAAAAQYPYGSTAHPDGKFGHNHKLEASGSNFPYRVELSRFNLYPSSVYSASCKFSVSRIHSLHDIDDIFLETISTPILDVVENPIHLKNLSIKELRQLAGEVRRELLSLMSRTTKSLKASLAAVEMTVAIHHVFHAPADKILWDAGEQTYGHKILAGRRTLMHVLRKKNGLSSNTSLSESEYDPFGAGHGCNIIAAGLGMAIARDSKGKRKCIITVISNGTTLAGQVYEAMSNTGYLDSNMILQ